MAIATINPATGETLRTFTALNETELDRKLAIAHQSFQQHKRTSFTDRAASMRRVAAIMDAEKDRLAHIITMEMGKPLQSAVQEVEKCAGCCRYYADNAERFLADEEMKVEAARCFVRYLPLGPVLAIMPWNFPFWQVFRFAVPALMAGNVGLLKHADSVPQCALAIEDLFRKAGFAEGCFQTLLIEVETVQRVIEDPRVAAVTITGSERAGRQIAAEAGKHLKRTVLELGGSDPFIVMPSADLDRAVEVGVTARTINSGQSCICAKRFIVHDAVYDAFERRFVAGMESLKIGDPLDPETQIGPLFSTRGVETLQSQVDRAVAAGGRILTGGKPLDRTGSYFPPTVLVDVPRSAPVYYEEFFGPVAMLFRVRDIDEAIEIANDTPYGLGSSVWTHDPDEQGRFINEIEAGQTFFNSMTASHPGVPFGGVKHSGYGRELSYFGIREFVNAKTIWFAQTKQKESRT